VLARTVCKHKHNCVPENPQCFDTLLQVLTCLLVTSVMHSVDSIRLLLPPGLPLLLLLPPLLLQSSTRCVGASLRPSSEYTPDTCWQFF
jgi:hypothetical protein